MLILWGFHWSCGVLGDYFRPFIMTAGMKIYLDIHDLDVHIFLLPCPSLSASASSSLPPFLPSLPPHADQLHSHQY